MDHIPSRTPSPNRPPTRNNTSSFSGRPSFSAPPQSRPGAGRFVHPQNSHNSTQTSLFPSPPLANQLAPPIIDLPPTCNQSQSGLPHDHTSQSASGGLQPPLSSHRSRPLDPTKPTPFLTFPGRGSSHFNIPTSLPRSSQTRPHLNVSALTPSSLDSQTLSHQNRFTAAQDGQCRPLEVQCQAHSSFPLAAHRPVLQTDFTDAAPQLGPPSRTASNFPPSATHLQPTRSDPFLDRNSLPFTTSQHQPPASPVAQSSIGRSQVTASAPTCHPVVALQQTGPSDTATLHPISNNLAQRQAPMHSTACYDIAKLLAAKCSIIGGEVYNDKGHRICGVLNQHYKPCRRIGKCPFHGQAIPVSAENSSNGIVDANGTAVSTAMVENVVSPVSLSPMVARNGSASVSATTAPPKKQQYKHGWSKEEHYLFLRGLQMHERGSWKQISNLVQSRNATQVQSHAQKFFLRQKQNNKNKRSIHDLTMDSPEMQEMDRKYRGGDLRSNEVSAGISRIEQGLFVRDGSSGNIAETHGPAVRSMIGMAGSNHAGVMRKNNPGLGFISDRDITRLGPHAALTNDAHLKPGQAMSATTLGSISSGVQIPQLTGAIHQRAGLHATSSSPRKIRRIALTRPGQAPGLRNNLLGNAKPPLSFVPKSAPAPILTSAAVRPANRISDAAILGTAADKGAPGKAEGDCGHTRYASSGFSRMSAHADHALLLPPTEVGPATDGQIGWQCGSDVKTNRLNPMSAKETIQFHGPFAGVPTLPIADGFNNMGGVNQEDHIIGSIGNQQGSAFAIRSFSGTDGAEMEESGPSYGAYGVAANGMRGFGRNGSRLGG